jgi:acetyltransferase
MGLPPLNMALAQRIIEKTKAYHLLKGFRGMPKVDIEMIQFLLVKFSYLVMDFPEIQEIDINPFAVDEENGLALDAHIVLDRDAAKNHLSPYDHLVIPPYPMHLQREVVMKNGQSALLRPIRPEDEPLEAAMFAQLSKQSIYLRFFGYHPQVNHETLVRFTQIDYDREMAIIAEIEEEGIKKMAGVVRIISDPWKNTAEYAIVVADPWQAQGIGKALTSFIIDIAGEMGIKKVYAEVLNVNRTMGRLLKNMGFSMREDGRGVNYFEREIVSYPVID